MKTFIKSNAFEMISNCCELEVKQSNKLNAS